MDFLFINHIKYKQIPIPRFLNSKEIPSYFRLDKSPIAGWIWSCTHNIRDGVEESNYGLGDFWRSDSSVKNKLFILAPNYGCQKRFLLNMFYCFSSFIKMS